MLDFVQGLAKQAGEVLLSYFSKDDLVFTNGRVHTSLLGLLKRK